MPGPSSTGAVAHAVRLGVRRGWTEFMLSVRSSQDQWFYLFTAFLAVGYLYLRRDTPVDDTGLLLPSVALPSILAGLIAFGLVIGPAYSLAMEKEDGTLLRAKAVPNGLVGYFAGQLVLHPRPAAFPEQRDGAADRHLHAGEASVTKDIAVGLQPGAEDLEGVLVDEVALLHQRPGVETAGHADIGPDG